MQGTVDSRETSSIVGSLEEGHTIEDDHYIIGYGSAPFRIKATPAARLLAKKHAINLAEVSGTGEHGVIGYSDVQSAAAKRLLTDEDFHPIRGMRREMHKRMVRSHQEVVPVSVFDEVDIACWQNSRDISVRLIFAIITACQKEPALNAWFDPYQQARRCFKEVHLGIAMDNEEGLFVPVIHNAAQYSVLALRQQINDFKCAAQARTLAPEQLQGATIILSNFGKFAGRFATPVVVPPTVATLAVGRLFHGVVCEENQLVSHPLLPLSLTFDHRVVTGGEATRFLSAIISSLRQPFIDEMR